jgi:hypothetical protein
MKLVSRATFDRVSRLASWMLVCAIGTLCACGGGGTASHSNQTTPGGGVGSGSDDDDSAAPDDNDVLASGPVDAGVAMAPPDKPKDPDPVKPDPPKAPDDPVYTAKTSVSRKDMSQYLVKPATAAADKRDWGRAIVLYTALQVARGPGSAEARKLADLWALAGDGERAVQVLDRYIAAADDATQVSEAKAARARMAAIEDPFAQRLRLPNLTAEAKKTFDLGRKAFKKKKYGDALVYYRMGYALDPDLPGNLRELGSTYEKLGAKDKMIDFYVAYLVRRPLGKNADDIRKVLAKEKGLLGTLNISTALECAELWLNGVPVPGVKPKKPKKLTVAPGEYTGLCYQPEYALVFKITRLPVTAGGKTEMAFNWALIENKLENPYGRISIESSYAPGVMMDLGIDTPVRAAIVPSDGRSLKMVLTDDSGQRSEERHIKLEPGQRYVIKW